MKDLSVVTSMYNEEQNVDKFIKEMIPFLKQTKLDTELIVVDNGSTDSTGKICDEFRKRYSRMIKVVHLKPPSLGKGNGVRHGIRYANGNYVALIDSDGQQNPKDITMLLNEMKKNNYGFIVGWRKNRRDPLERKVFSKIYNFLVKLLFNLPIKDVGGQPRVFKREALAKKIFSTRWIIEVELPYKAKRMGFKGGYAVVHHRSRHAGKSKVNLKRVYEIFMDMIKLRMGSKDV